MRITAFLIAALMALASLSTNVDARTRHRQKCQAPDQYAVKNMALVGWVSLFVGGPLTVLATSQSDSAAAQVMRCGGPPRAGKGGSD
jgi:hypothetical protein